MTALARTYANHGRNAILLIVGALLVAIAAACSGGDEQDGVLATLSAKSGDVEIVVDVPEGALPSGVAVADISVVGLDLDEAFADHEGVDPVGAYRFEPAGVEFEVPLRVTVEFADGLSRLLAQLVSSDGTVEALEPVALALSTSDETLRATYEIEHFSNIELFRSRTTGDDAAIVVLPPPLKPTYFVGESFTVRVRVHAGSARWSAVRLINGRGVKQERATLPDEPWSARVDWHTDGDSGEFIDILGSAFGSSRDSSNPLRPERVTTNTPSPNTGTATFSEQTFTCTQAGNFHIAAIAYVDLTGELVTTEAGGASTVSRYTERQYPSSKHLNGICVAPDVTVDPTPDPTETVVTPTPTEEPTPSPTPTPPPIAPTLAAGFDPCHINPNEEAIGCLPHYDLVSASSSVPTIDERLMYESTWEFGAPIPTNPERPIEYWLVLEGENGQRMEFLLEGGPGQPLTCTRSISDIPTPLGPGEACGELFAPNTLRFAGDVTAFAPGKLRRTFSTLELGADGIARGDYAPNVGEGALELSVPE